MVTVTRAFADQIAEIARLLKGDDVPDAALRRLTSMGVELVPGAVAAVVTVAMAKGALNFAASDQRLIGLHDLQFDSATGPAVEALHHAEPRRVDDTAAERRWPVFCQAAGQIGLASCLALPLRTDRRPSGAVVLYGQQPNVFRGVAHDIALLFAAQGGTTLRNASLYRSCRRMMHDLQSALESRAVIEQAKGVLHAELGVSPAEAFRLLSKFSQDTNRRVREVSSALVQGQMRAADLSRSGGHC